MIEAPLKSFLVGVQPAAGDIAQPVLVGYSGGGDSTALLHLLQAAGFQQIIACHLHHGLRGEEADRDAAFCHEVAQEINVTFEMRHAEVGELASDSKQSIETAGRQARHRFFAEMSRKHQTNQLYLAHHADDQAETVLQHLLRGAGLQGLGGMAASSALWVDEVELRLHRPLLAFTHAELVDLNERYGWKYREDSTNVLLSNRRNRIRHQVVPALAAAGFLDAVKSLGRAAELAREDDRCLQQLAEEVLAQCQVAPETPQLQWKLLARQPVALQRRILRSWLRQAAIADVGFNEIEAVRALLTDANRPARVNLPGDWQAGRKSGHLFLRKLL